MNQEEQNKNIELQEAIIPEETSKRITALRFLLAILVVFIHNNFTHESIKYLLGFVPLFNPNQFTQWVQIIISGSLGNCAVPLFFVFASYLQVRKNDSYKVLLKKRTKSLLLPYVLWISIYLIYRIFGKLLIAKIQPSLLVNPDKTVLTWGIKKWISFIVGYGQYFGFFENNHPAAAAQFWFVRDLMILVVLSNIIIKLIKKFTIGFFIMIAILYFSGQPVYFVSTSALFYYSLGLYWGIYNLKLFELVDRIRWIEVLILFIIGSIMSNTSFVDNSFMSGISTMTSCLLFLKISGSIIKSEKIFSIASYFSGYSFFLYAIHMPALLYILQRLWITLFPMKNGFFCLFEYFGVTILIIITGTAIGIILKKICLPLFALLNGGRK